MEQRTAPRCPHCAGTTEQEQAILAAVLRVYRASGTYARIQIAKGAFGEMPAIQQVRTENVTPQEWRVAAKGKR